MRIRKGEREIQYMNVHTRDCAEVFEKSVLGDEVVERLLFADGASACERAGDIPFYARQTRRILDDMAERDVRSIGGYAASGGLDALEKALFSMTPAEVVDAVDASGLRGRGGGGFSTGFKWRAVVDAPGTEKYVVCNGDEGDPGAFLDGAIMEGDPYRLIEGMLLAGYAVGASRGFVYVRDEYPISIRRLNDAIGRLEALGLLGEDILGSGFSFRLTVYRGAGAFVCGEESALVNSLEGRRGMPRIKPPYLATEGFHGLPTLVNNVETYANVPFIVTHGAQAYRALGTPGCPGTKIYSLSGAVRYPGLVEVPLGTTLREIVFGIGEAMKKNTLMHSNERQEASQQLTEAIIDFTEGMGIDIKSLLYGMLGGKLAAGGSRSGGGGNGDSTGGVNSGTGDGGNHGNHGGPDPAEAAGDRRDGCEMRSGLYRSHVSRGGPRRALLQPRPLFLRGEPAQIPARGERREPLRRGGRHGLLRRHRSGGGEQHLRRRAGDGLSRGPRRKREGGVAVPSGGPGRLSALFAGQRDPGRALHGRHGHDLCPAEKMDRGPVRRGDCRRRIHPPAAGRLSAHLPPSGARHPRRSGGSRRKAGQNRCASRTAPTRSCSLSLTSSNATCLRTAISISIWRCKISPSAETSNGSRRPRRSMLWHRRSAESTASC